MKQILHGAKTWCLWNPVKALLWYSRALNFRMFLTYHGWSASWVFQSLKKITSPLPTPDPTLSISRLLRDCTPVSVPVAWEAEFCFPKKGSRKEHRLSVGSCGPVALLLLDFQPVYSVKLRAGSGEHCVCCYHLRFVYTVESYLESWKETFSGLGSKWEHLGQKEKEDPSGWEVGGRRGIFKSQSKYGVTK